jgi:hypothetical protein
MRGLASAAILAGLASIAGMRPAGPVAATGSLRGVVGVSGAVAYSGTPPAGVPVDMGGDRYCTAANEGGPVLQHSVVTDAQGRLANVIVYVKEGLPKGTYPVPREAALLDQQNCFYTPRVVAVRVNQPLLIRNSDATLHNVHVHAKVNKAFNLGQPIRGIEARRSFTSPEFGIHVGCDVHGWMSGTIAVFEHPFFAVTQSNGGFEINDLPVGEYVIEAWHESLGARQQRVTVGPGAATAISFTFGG